jgi:hypothetical protein
MRRTPQEKKRLSYEKDRRNDYGGAPHAARKSIPLRKALRNRANRHLQEKSLRTLCGRPDVGALEEAESLMRRRAPHAWKKERDEPLGEIVRRKTGWRRELQEAGGCDALFLRRKLAREGE